MDVKVNNVSYDDVEFIAIPKKDGSGNAYFRNVNSYFKKIYDSTSETIQTVNPVPNVFSDGTLQIPSGCINAQIYCNPRIITHRTVEIK